MKILKKKLLFSLLSETLTEYKPYKWLYYCLSEYRSGSIRDAAVRLAKAGLVDKINRGNQVFFRLTSMGADQFKREVSSWDHIWRVVISLPAPAGGPNRLERELIRLGYKQLARGVYICPLPVSETTKQLFLMPKYLNCGNVIESKRLVVGDDRQWASRLWQLEEIGQKYTDFVNICARLLKLSRQNFGLLNQAKGGFKTVFDLYFKLFLLDPGLPSTLLPSDWQKEEAKKLFIQLSQLAKTAGI